MSLSKYEQIEISTYCDIQYDGVAPSTYLLYLFEQEEFYDYCAAIYKGIVNHNLPEPTSWVQLEKKIRAYCEAMNGKFDAEGTIDRIKILAEKTYPYIKQIKDI